MTNQAFLLCCAVIVNCFPELGWVDLSCTHLRSVHTAELLPAVNAIPSVHLLSSVNDSSSKPVG